MLTHREVIDDQYQGPGVLAHALADGAVGVLGGDDFALFGDADQMLLARAQQVTERHQCVTVVTCYGQGGLMSLAFDFDGPVEAPVFQVGVQAHTACADHRHIRQTASHQVGQL